MKSGCYLTLALLSGLVLAEQAWLKRTLDPPEVWIAAIIAGGASWLAIGAIWNAWAAGGTLHALRQARDGGLPEDGGLAAIAGTIHPVGEPLIAPFSQQPCVIYEYEVTRDQTRKNNDGAVTNQKVVDFAGIGMAPCEIRTERDAVGLYGFPELEEFPSKKCLGPRDDGMAQKFVRETEWEDCTGLGMLRGFGAMLGALTSTGEAIYRNWRMISPAKCAWLPQENGESSEAGYFPSLNEKRVQVGERVVAVGIYHAAAPALTTRTGTNLRRLQLLRGDLAPLVDRTAKTRWQSFVGGYLALFIIHAIAFGLLALYRNSDDTQRRWQRTLESAINKADLETIERLIPQRLDVNVRFANHNHQATPLFLTKDPEVARLLIARGADVNFQGEAGTTPLMVAALHGRLEMLQVLLDAGADVHLTRASGDTALKLAEFAGKPECAALLRAAEQR